MASRLDIAPVSLTELETTQIAAFVHALNGTQWLKERLGQPDRVPSGLEVAQ